MAFHHRNNVQGVGRYEADECGLFTTRDPRNEDVLRHQKAYVAKLAAELNALRQRDLRPVRRALARGPPRRQHRRAAGRRRRALAPRPAGRVPRGGAAAAEEARARPDGAEPLAGPLGRALVRLAADRVRAAGRPRAGAELRRRQADRRRGVGLLRPLPGEVALHGGRGAARGLVVPARRRRRRHQPERRVPPRAGRGRRGHARQDRAAAQGAQGLRRGPRPRRRVALRRGGRPAGGRARERARRSPGSSTPSISSTREKKRSGARTSSRPPGAIGTR